jgi:hypothetical protein
MTVMLTTEPVSARTAAEGLYVRFNLGAEQFVALSLDGRRPSGRVAAVVLIDQLMQDRVDALHRFHDVMFGRPAPPDRRLPSQRKRHLIEMLRAVDGKSAGATYQEIAESIFNTKRVSAVSWKSAPQRDMVMRRVRTGLALVNGGYRKLLYSQRIRQTSK